MADPMLPDAAYLRQCIDYDPITGVFTWRPRAWAMAVWNARYADTVAGNIAPTGYRQISVKFPGRISRPYLAHRLAWLHVTGLWPKRDIDHKNGRQDDNRFENLREAVAAQNGLNRGKNKNNPSGFKGVRRGAREGSWTARIMINRNGIHLGTFESAEDAHAAYCTAARHYGGEFANSGDHGAPCGAAPARCPGSNAVP